MAPRTHGLPVGLGCKAHIDYDVGPRLTSYPSHATNEGPEVAHLGLIQGKIWVLGCFFNVCPRLGTAGLLTPT